MTNDESNESDTQKKADSEKKGDYSYAQELKNKITQIEQVEKGRREAEEKKTVLAKEIRKNGVIKEATDVRPLAEREKKPLTPPKDMKSKSNGFITGSFEKIKPSKLKRELIPFLFISIITFSSLIYFSYPDSSGSIAYSPEIPIINIEVSSEITSISQQCFLKFTPVSLDFLQSNWVNRNLAAIIRKRDSDGGFSFELFQRESLFKMRDDDDWLLLPPGKNLDSFRTKMAFDVYNMLKENDTSYMLPQSKLVEVYINGNYESMYLLSERIDRKLMDLEQENIANPEENDAVFKINNWDGDFFTIPTSLNSPWEQLYPNYIDFSQIPIYLTEFIHNTSEENFFNEENGIFTIFDKGELIDNLLFGLLVGHEIIEGSSYYLIYNQNLTSGHFFLPWDFGQSWGYSKDGSIPNNLWLNDITDEIESVCWSKLYYRLLFPNDSSINDEFVSEIKDRWSYIRSNLLKSDDLTVYFNSLYSTIQNTLLRTTSGYDFILNFASTIDSWILTRLNLLDNIFSEPDTIFNDNFEPPFREDEEIFGFSSPAAKRHYFKSSLLFSRDKMHEVNVVIQRDYLNDMIVRKKDSSRLNDRRYMPADVSIDDYSMDNTGFRIRGNYNKNYPKDSFKLKFSETELYLGGSIYEYMPENENRRLFGLRRLNLRAAPTDFSFMNEVAGYEIYKILGYPYPRVSWAKLYITETDSNGNIIKQGYKGLYLLTEDIDQTFLNYNFKNPEGNLYKTTDIPATLEYKTNFKNYFTYDGRRIYELRTNEEQDDYSDLQDFAYSINYNWSNIQNTTNLTLLAKYFAASNFQGNWDDYVFLPHNFFLYSEPNYGFVLLPWDIEQNLNMGTGLSIVGFAQPYSPGFRYAPLLSGYEDYFDFISEWAMIDPYPRPLWDNLILDLDFIDKYYDSHEKITDNIYSSIAQIWIWFNFIEPTVTLPFQYTDPSFNPLGDWIRDFQTDPLVWFSYDKNRVLNFLDIRAQFVLGELP